MFDNSIRIRALVGGAAGLTFVLALAVAVGILPRAGADGTQSTELTAASAAPTVPVAAPEAAPATEAPAPAPEAPAPTSRSSVTTAAPQESEDSSPEPAAAPAPAPVAAPAGVARVTPSSAQVQAAIQGFHQRIPLFTPSAAQVADFGNQVCTAFDQGQSYAQVKATGMQMVSGYPISISSADADWMIHTAVSLYCPGYAGKLG